MVFILRLLCYKNSFPWRKNHGWRRRYRLHSMTVWWTCSFNGSLSFLTEVWRNKAVIANMSNFRRSQMSGRHNNGYIDFFSTIFDRHQSHLLHTTYGCRVNSMLPLKVVCGVTVLFNLLCSLDAGFQLWKTKVKAECKTTSVASIYGYGKLKSGLYGLYDFYQNEKLPVGWVSAFLWLQVKWFTASFWNNFGCKFKGPLNICISETAPHQNRLQQCS